MKYNRVYLSDVAELIPGFAFKSKDFCSSNQKVIKIGDISPAIRENQLTGVNLLNYDKDKISKYRCSTGDYFVAMTGNTIGKIGKIVEGSAYANQRVLIVRAKTKCIVPEYLWCILKQRSFYKHIVAYIDSNSAQPNISASSIGKYSFALPKFEDQLRISRVICCFEKKIVLNEAINDYLAA